MTFTLKITLGNAEMSSGAHIADALSKVSMLIDSVDEDGLPGRSGTIRDINGNKVGEWKVSKS